MDSLLPWLLIGGLGLAIFFLLSNTVMAYRPSSGKIVAFLLAAFGFGAFIMMSTLAMSDDSDPKSAPLKKESPRGVYAVDGEEIFHHGQSCLAVTVENGRVTYAKFQIHEDLGNGRYQEHFLWTEKPIRANRPTRDKLFQLAAGVHLYQHDLPEQWGPSDGPLEEQVSALLKKFNNEFPQSKQKPVLASEAKAQKVSMTLNGEPRNFECWGGTLSVRTRGGNITSEFVIGPLEVNGEKYVVEGGKPSEVSAPESDDDRVKAIFYELQERARQAGIK